MEDQANANFGGDAIIFGIGAGVSNNILPSIYDPRVDSKQLTSLYICSPSEQARGNIQPDVGGDQSTQERIVSENSPN